MTLASECLAAADAAVRDRRESYGSPQDNYARLSAFLSPLLEMDVSALQGVLICIQMKISRLMNDPLHEDSWIDIAGYAAVGFEIMKLIKEKEDGGQIRTTYGKDKQRREKFLDEDWGSVSLEG